MIGPGKTSAPLVFQAAADAPIGHARITITGKATIDGHEVVPRRPRRRPDLADGQHARHRPDGRRRADRRPRGAAVRRRPRPPATAEAAAGDKLPIAVTLRPRRPTGPARCSSPASTCPTTRTSPWSTSPTSQTEAKVELALPANLKPGPYTFTINGAGQVPRDYLAPRDSKAEAKDEDKSKSRRGNNVRAVFPSNPITLTVSAASAEEVSSGPAD